MASGKNIYKVLVAGANDKTFALLQTLLPGSSYDPPLRAGSAGEAKRMALDYAVDIAILNAPMRDEFGTQLALSLARDNVGVLLLVPGESFDGVRDQVEDEGVMALAKPLTRQTLEMGLHMITALRGKLLQMDRRNRALQEKMTDIRTINRAKWLLIEQLRMTESEAHYYIERQAMDTRLSRREVAENIIRSYDQ
jgi:AmiR/NasT family two-component response regulator